MPQPERPADWLEAFGPGARTAVATAQAGAEAFGHNYLGSEHLLIGLTGAAGVDQEQLRLRLIQRLQDAPEA